MSDIVIDLGARLIRRDGIDVHLAPKAFDLLMLLVTHQPNAVSHQQLHAELWPGLHVSETSLAALVTQLRKALGDTTGGEPSIRTLHRVGYAFVGSVRIVEPTTRITARSCRLLWRGNTFDLPGGESMIGRDRRCAVQIDTDSISRQHARILVTATDVSVEDLESKNGTWVAGVRITGRVTLADGDSIRLGTETVRVEIGHELQSTRTVVS